MCFPEVTEGQYVSIPSSAEETAIARRHVLGKLYSLDLSATGIDNARCQLLGPSTPKGRKMAGNFSVAQDDLESQHAPDGPHKGRVRAVRSPIKGFIVCVLSVTVLLILYTRLQVT